MRMSTAVRTEGARHVLATASTSFPKPDSTAGTLAGCSRLVRDDAQLGRRRGRRVPRHRVQGRQRPARRGPGDPRAGAPAARAAQLQAGPAAAAAGPARSDWSCAPSTASGRSRSSAASPAPSSTSSSRPCLPDAAAATWAEDVAAPRRAGVIVVTSQFTAAQKRVFQRAGIPCVVIDPVDLPDPDVPSVGATNWAGGLAATRHLLELGHRRIAVIGGPPACCAGARASTATAPRWNRPACRRPRADPGRHLLPPAGTTRRRALLDLPDPPTAIFAASDSRRSA